VAFVYVATDDSRITVATSTEEALTLLAERGATAVCVDGGKVIADWLRRGLIDNIVLTRTPVLLGGGIPLFGPLDTDVHLIHLATTLNDAGTTSSRYRVAMPTGLRCADDWPYLEVHMWVNGARSA